MLNYVKSSCIYLHILFLIVNSLLILFMFPQKMSRNRWKNVGNSFSIFLHLNVLIYILFLVQEIEKLLPTFFHLYPENFFGNINNSHEESTIKIKICKYCFTRTFDIAEHLKHHVYFCVYPYCGFAGNLEHMQKHVFQKHVERI